MLVEMRSEKGVTKFSVDGFAFGEGGVEFVNGNKHTFIPYHFFNYMTWEEEDSGEDLLSNKKLAGS